MNRLARSRRAVDRAYCDLAERFDRVLVPLGNVAFNLYARAFPGRFLRRVEDAIRRGILFFERQEALTFDAVATFRMMVDTSCEPRLARLDGKILEYAGKRNDPHLRLLDAGYDPGGPEHSAKEGYDPDVLDPVEKPVLSCLYADRTGADDDLLAEVDALEDGGGYGTTHRLLACIVLKRFGRLPEADLDARIESALSVIAEAQRSSSASDIFFERTVLLQWLGWDRLVEPAWIVRIVRAQRGGGGWRWDRSFRRLREEQHPSCCGLAALIQFREKRLKGRQDGVPTPAVLGRAMTP